MIKSKYAENWDFSGMEPITDYDIEHAEEQYEELKCDPEEAKILRSEMLRPSEDIYPPHKKV